MFNKIKNHFKEYGNLYLFILSIGVALALFIWLIFVSDYLKNFLSWLESFVQNHVEYAYWVAFIAAIVEGTIVLGVLPGTTYIITMGVFLARGEIEWQILLPLVIIGATIGDLIGYTLGKFFSNFLKKLYSDDTSYKMAIHFIHTHGGKSVFIARFISGIKEFVPFIAGTLKMPLKKFIFWDFLGAIGWSIFWIMVGYVGGSFVKDVESITKVVGIVLLIFFSISAFIFYQKNKETLLKN